MNVDDGKHESVRSILAVLGSDTYTALRALANPVAGLTIDSPNCVVTVSRNNRCCGSVSNPFLLFSILTVDHVRQMSSQRSRR